MKVFLYLLVEKIKPYMPPYSVIDIKKEMVIRTLTILMHTSGFQLSGGNESIMKWVNSGVYLSEKKKWNLIIQVVLCYLGDWFINFYFGVFPFQRFLETTAVPMRSWFSSSVEHSFTFFICFSLYLGVESFEFYLIILQLSPGFSILLFLRLKVSSEHVFLSYFVNVYTLASITFIIWMILFICTNI